jgi:hypothetical protein
MTFSSTNRWNPPLDRCIGDQFRTGIVVRDHAMVPDAGAVRNR